MIAARRFRLRLEERNEDKREWVRLKAHECEFTIRLQDNIDPIWIEIEDTIVARLEEMKAVYEGRKTRQ